MASQTNNPPVSAESGAVSKRHGPPGESLVSLRDLGKRQHVIRSKRGRLDQHEPTRAAWIDRARLKPDTFRDLSEAVRGRSNGLGVRHGSVTIAERESGCKRNRQAILALRDEAEIARLERAISDHDSLRALPPGDDALAAVNDRLPTARGHVVARAPGAARVDREHAKLLALALDRQVDDLVTDHGRQVRGQGSRGDDVVSGVHGSVSIAERKPTCKRNRQAIFAHKERRATGPFQERAACHDRER